ncbi:FAD-dependent monooxygenase [Amycolatopsis ultiminotia]|uniref:FAD-dependent monooxygenase n=1 Tax=Amycolatopsis ultiminotia TaxID=543629 RepID=A0ABP6YNH1_9PSEU
MSETPHVIVIGAGTGGMCFAHGLKRAGIRVSVYEADRTRKDGLYGYRVGIDPHGTRALQACLPPELFETFLATCARQPRYFSMLTEKDKEIFTLDLPPDANQIDSEKSVSRMTLRQVLLTGLEDVVEFGKRFTHYEKHDDGRVTAYFQDGTSATGDMLVAADGPGSRVRRQYLPHAELVPAGVISVAGKVAIDERTRHLLSERVFYGLSLVFAPKGFFNIFHVMEFPWNKDGKAKEGIGGNEKELIENWPGMLYDNTQDYINWGFAAATDKYPKDILKVRGQELMDLILGMTEDWHPNYRELIRLTDPSTCFPINIMTSKPIPLWEPTNITLIGDAIHTMTPGRGVGANTALRDAALLAKNLTAVRDGEMKLMEAIHDYEAQMVEYGFAAVKDSLKQQGGDSIMHKPVLGRIALAGMRASMRTVNAVPFLKKQFAKGLLAPRGNEQIAEQL